MTCRPRTSLPRLMVTCWSCQFPLAAYFAPTSLIAEAMAVTGALPDFFMLLLTVAIGISALDCLLNDAMPERCMHTLRDHRHIGFMLMCICLLMLGGTLSLSTGTVPIFVVFLMPAVFSAVVVWPDMKSRHHRYAA